MKEPRPKLYTFAELDLYFNSMARTIVGASEIGLLVQVAPAEAGAEAPLVS